MGIPLNDLRRVYQLHANELESRAIEVMRSGWWISGEQNKLFCEQFAEYLGVSHCLGVGNGTDALEIAIRALIANDARFNSPRSVTEGTAPEIVTVANAGGYATIAIYLTGCVPVYADIETDSQLMSLDSALACVGKQTVAVVATHLYGGLVQISELRSVLNKAGYSHVAILEDCAQAHGLTSEAGRAGSLGDISTFSFYPTKNLGALGDGGAIATSNNALSELVRCLHQYGWVDKYMVGRACGRNSRLDEFQAAMLSVLLPKLDMVNASRVNILDRYQEALPAGVSLVRSSHGTVGHLAIVKCRERNRLREHMSSMNISTDIHYPVLDCDQNGWERLDYKVGPTGLEVSLESVDMILTIPCFASMTDSEIDLVCRALSSFVV